MAYGIAAECYPWWDQLFQKQIVEQFDFKVPFSYKIFEGSIILHFLYHCHLKATKILLLWANTPLVEYIIQKKKLPFPASMPILYGSAPPVPLSLVGTQ